MRLSMWILADWLERYNPVIKIENGEQNLRGVRILSADTCIERQNVYLASAKEFFNDGDDQIICVQGHDMLLLNTADMDSVLNDIFDAFDFYYGWDDGMAENIRKGCSLEYLVEQSFEVFKEPIIIFDADHVALAISTQFGLGSVDQEWDTVIQTGVNSMETLKGMREHLHNSRFRRGVDLLSLPVTKMRSLQRMLFQEKNIFGRLIMLEHCSKITKGKVQLLDNLGKLIEYWQVQNQEKRELQKECELFCKLLAAIPISEEELEYKLHLNGWQAEHKKLLLKIEVPANYSDIFYPLFTHIQHQLRECYAFIFEQAIYILSNLFYITKEKLLETIFGILSSSKGYCGVSYEFHSVYKLAEYQKQCMLALQYSDLITGNIYFCEDHALDYISSIIRSNVDRSVVHPAWFLLEQHDLEKKNELKKTLYCYLKNNCNLVLTAKELSLHRNSLLYRINKIKEISKINLGDANTRIYLTLSYLVINEIK